MLKNLLREFEGHREIEFTAISFYQNIRIPLSRIVYIVNVVLTPRISPLV